MKIGININRWDKLYLSIGFEIPTLPIQNNQVLGIDLGCKRLVTTSNGQIIDNIEPQRQLISSYRKQVIDSGGQLDTTIKFTGFGKLIKNKGENYNLALFV